jgi:hypothetical protein
MIGNGLPAYTVPPATGSAGLPPTTYGKPVGQKPATPPSTPTGQKRATPPSTPTGQKPATPPSAPATSRTAASSSVRPVSAAPTVYGKPAGDKPAVTYGTPTAGAGGQASVPSGTSASGTAGQAPATYGTPAPKTYPGFPSAPENIDMTQPVPGDRTQPVQLGHPYGGGATTPVPNGVPQQRAQDSGGTVYSTGGYPSIGNSQPSIDMTMPVSMDPVENSGSLTGHILAQGWHDGPVDQRRSNFKVVIAMLAVLGLLVTISLVFVFTAGDAFTDMVKGLAN